MVVAVSGGADSVALLRVMREMRAELGIVLAVAHLNHGLRGEESQADEAFVAELAKQQQLEYFPGRGDVRDHALTSKLSIEAAGRELRYRWLAQLAAEQRFDAVATAHTLDDQAETVLLKFLRGAGTRGLAGIYPVLRLGDGVVYGPPDGMPFQILTAGRTNDFARIIRPLLSVSRDKVETYLESLGQPWREDETNLDRRFTRNRVRHDLLPLLEREFNPNIRALLSDAAEVSRAEEEYWQTITQQELSLRVKPASPAQLRGQVEENLRQLGRDHLDVVNLRLPRRMTTGSIAEHFGTLAGLRDAGLIRHLGISNVTSAHLAQARSIAPVVCVQNPFGIGAPAAERAASPGLRRAGRGVRALLHDRWPGPRGRRGPGRSRGSSARRGAGPRRERHPGPAGLDPATRAPRAGHSGHRKPGSSGGQRGGVGRSAAAPPGEMRRLTSL